uniref:Uncharacterized protein n=1 Tax=Oryza glumipatula TaxID=40148 RepID=A0A0E0BR22_9ORYZ
MLICRLFHRGCHHDDLHGLRHSSMAMQNAITEIKDGLDKVTKSVLALRAGFEAKKVRGETTTMTTTPSLSATWSEKMTDGSTAWLED